MLKKLIRWLFPLREFIWKEFITSISTEKELFEMINQNGFRADYYAEGILKYTPWKPGWFPKRIQLVKMKIGDMGFKGHYARLREVLEYIEYHGCLLPIESSYYICNMVPESERSEQYDTILMTKENLHTKPFLVIPFPVGSIEFLALDQKGLTKKIWWSCPDSLFHNSTTVIFRKLKWYQFW